MKRLWDNSIVTEINMTFKGAHFSSVLALAVTWKRWWAYVGIKSGSDMPIKSLILLTSPFRDAADTIAIPSYPSDRAPIDHASCTNDKAAGGRV